VGDIWKVKPIHCYLTTTLEKQAKGKNMEVKITQQSAILKVKTNQVVAYQYNSSMGKEYAKMIAFSKLALIEAIRDKVITAIKFKDSLDNVVAYYIGY
jgi:hypothetical protein